MGSLKTAICLTLITGSVAMADESTNSLLAEARTLHADYGHSANRSQKPRLRSKIKTLFGKLNDVRTEDAAQTVALFYSYSELDVATTDCLVKMQTKAARLEIQKILEKAVRRPKATGATTMAPAALSRRATILDACEDLRGSFASKVMRLILAEDPYRVTITSALDFLAPRLTSNNAIAVLESLEKASSQSALKNIDSKEQATIYLDFYKRAFELTYWRPLREAEAAKKKDEDDKKGKSETESSTSSSKAAYVRTLDEEGAKTIYARCRELGGDASKRVSTRAVALGVLGMQKQEGTLEVLESIFKEERDNPKLIVAATQAAIQLGDPKAGNHVLKIIDKWIKAARRNPVIEEDLVYLIEAIYPLRIQKADSVLSKLLRSNQLYIRAAAVVSIPVLDDSKARTYLKKHLTSKVWRLRLAAIEACRRMKSATAVGLLIEHMPKETGRLRFDLLMALHELSGARMPYVVEDWEKWWGISKATYKPPSSRKKVDKDSKTLVLFPEGDLKSTYFGMHILSKRLAFVIDTSGSMGAEMAYEEGDSTRIEVMKEELIKLVKSFQKGTYFNLYFFNTGYNKLFKQLSILSRNNYGKVKKFVSGVRASGGTNLYDPLAEALQDPYVDTIFVLSDGSPTAGKFTAENDILREVRKVNRTRGIQINTISIGMDSKLMRRLAEQNGGDYKALE